VWQFLAAIPIGIFSAGAFATRNSILRPALILAIALGALEALQVPIYSHRASTVELALSLAGALTGLAAGRTMVRSPLTEVPRSRSRSGILWPSLAVIWVALLVLWQWWPFAFRPDPEFLRARIFALPKIPFENYYHSSTARALEGLSWKFFLGVMTGIMLVQAWPAPAGSPLQRLRSACQLVIAVTLFIVLETGQLFVESRYPDPTDIAIEAAGSALALATLANAKAKTFVR
jgi:hypothetical protein